MMMIENIDSSPWFLSAALFSSDRTLTRLWFCLHSKIMALSIVFVVVCNSTLLVIWCGDCGEMHALPTIRDTVNPNPRDTVKISIVLRVPPPTHNKTIGGVAGN